MNKQRKRGAAAGVLLFCLLAAVLGAIWWNTRPEPVSGEKHITVEVLHSGGSEARFAYDTDEEYLGDLLLEEGLISGTEGPYGLYVETVDGETADYNVDGGWWKLVCNGEDSMVGVDNVVINNGDLYVWYYTTG